LKLHRDILLPAICLINKYKDGAKMNEDNKTKDSQNTRDDNNANKPLAPDSKDIIALIIAALQVLAPYVLIMILVVVGIMWVFKLIFR
jgi:hypothetical protein